MLKVNSKNIFLLDGMGAVVSASIMGLIVARQVNFFGMPSSAAYFLAAFPCVFFICSMYCHFNLPKDWKPYLKMISIANLLYCFISIGVVFYHYESLTNFGLTYFILEIVVILIVVVLELRVVKEGE